MKDLWTALVLVFAVGCGGRLVPAPTNPRDYQRVELRDVAPLGMTNVNVEVVAALGPMVSQEVCRGLVTFPLMSITGRSVVLGGTVTISVPRERYSEVREFLSGDHVRVRGYLSKYFADHCDWYMRTSDRYLWVDTIERVSDPGNSGSPPVRGRRPAPGTPKGKPNPASDD